MLTLHSDENCLFCERRQNLQRLQLNKLAKRSPGGPVKCGQIDKNADKFVEREDTLTIP